MSLDVLAEKDRESLLTGVVSGEIDRVIARMRDEGWKNLDPQRRAFVLAFVEAGNVREASTLMGLADLSVARKLYNDPLVRAAISDVQDVILRDTTINQGRVRAMMHEVYERAIGREPVKAVVDGTIIETELTNLPVAKAAAEWFGKELGMTATDKSKRGAVIVNIDFGRVSKQAEGSVTIEQLPDAGDISD